MTGIRVCARTGWLGVMSAIALCSTALTALPAAAATASVQVPCSGSGGGEVGLVAAIDDANATPEPDRIVLAQGCTYALTQSFDIPDGGGLPAITSPVEISAGRVSPTTTIARAASAPAFGIINVNAPGALTLANITVRGGVAEDGFGGAGIGVAPGASAHLIGSRVTDNRVTYTTNFEAIGGGVWNLGDLTLDSSRVDHNVVENHAANNLAVGGGIANEGISLDAAPATLVMRNSTVDANRVLVDGSDEPGAVGGGIASLGHVRATLIGSDVTDNRAVATNAGGVALGAGVFDNLDFFTGEVDVETTVIGGRISRNIASASLNGFAAGAGMFGAFGDHTTVVGAEITSNTSSAGGDGAVAQGGALFTEPGADLVLGFQTIVAGNAVRAAGVGVAADGGGLANIGKAALHGAVIRNNTAIAKGAQSEANGGGIWNSSGAAPDGLSIDHTIITSNRAAAGGGVYNDAGSILLGDATTIRHNLPDDCAPPGSVPGC
jgi:hypothetical protein